MVKYDIVFCALMHDPISIAYNSKKSTCMKLIFVSFESYRIEDFFGFKKPSLIYLLNIVLTISSTKGQISS